MKNAGAIVGVPYKREAENRIEAHNRIEAQRKEIWEKAQTHIVVTTLIATITFATGFTIPGGFIQSGSPHQGMSVLTKSTAFWAFIISDTIALVLSASAIFIYFVASIYRKWIRILRFFTAAIYLNVFALFAMMVAFVTGIYAVLGNSLALAIATCLVGSCFFLVYIAVIVRLVSDAKQDRLLTFFGRTVTNYPL